MKAASENGHAVKPVNFRTIHAKKELKDSSIRYIM